MNNTGNPLTNEILQLVTILKGKGYSEMKAIAFVAGAAYSQLSDTQKTLVFDNASKV